MVFALALACADEVLEAKARGNLQLRAGHPEEALRAYDEAAANAKSDPEVSYLRGVALAELGRDAEAQQAWLEAVRLRPRYGLARRELALAAFRAGRTAEAIAALRQVLEVDPGDVFTMNRLAEAHTQVGELAQADAMVEAVLRRDPQNPLARRTAARVAVARGDTEAALRFLDGLGSGEPWVAYERALALAHSDPERAIGELTTALAAVDGPGRTAALSDPRLAPLLSDPRVGRLRP